MRQFAWALTVALLCGVAGSVQGQPGGGSDRALRHPFAADRAPNGRQAGDRMSSLYGHVVVLTDSQNQTQRFWVRADHTFSWQGAMGEKGHGRWTLTNNGSTVCLAALTGPKGRELARPAKPRCAEFRPGHAAGDRWQQRNDRGEQIALEVR
ncbi:MAG: hypothetical protein ACHP84_15610 [Caulobacterales bacterium]